MKKIYQKPAMRVVELQQRTQLLTQSGDQWLNYIPEAPGNSENHLA